MDILEISQRIWENMLARPRGPLALRFLMQPAMSTIFAIRDGLKDAREGRSPYFWTVLTAPEGRSARLREAIKATGKIIILALILDTAYQVIELGAFYPLEAIIVAVVLAVIPYLLIRGPAARIAHWWSGNSALGGAW